MDKPVMDLVSLRKGLAGSPFLGVLEARGPRGYLEISSVASKLLVALVLHSIDD